MNRVPNGQYKQRDSLVSRLKLGVKNVISETSGAKCDWEVSKRACVIGRGSGAIRKARGHIDSVAYDQKFSDPYV